MHGNSKTNKTGPTNAHVKTFLSQVSPATKQSDARILNQLFCDVTSFHPIMWGPSIIGYGRYDYRYASGRKGSSLATGFSPRTSHHSIYIMPGYTDFSTILDRLGKHKTGKSCLYINKLADIDFDVLAELIHAGLKDLNTKWTVHPS